MYRDGFLCPLCGQLMGETAENLVREYGILRAEQDAYAVESQRRAGEAIARRPLRRRDRSGHGGGQGRATSRSSEDEHPRPDTTLEALAKLPPVFDPQGGTVHAGNSSGITDGGRGRSCSRPRRRRARPASSRWPASRPGRRPASSRRAWASGPCPAIRALLAKTRLKLADIDLIELNEAFAAQVIACARELPLDLSRVNVNGGAIALGHPIGATGARIATTLLHEMKRRGARRGIATLCVSGGMGMAVLFER